MAEYIYEIEYEGMLGPIPYVTGRNTGEQIVRCKDCKHYFAEDDEWGVCNLPECERRWSGQYHYAEPHDFCSWGEPITANGGVGGAVR